MNTKYIKLGTFITLGSAIVLVGFLITQFSTWGQTNELFPRLNKGMLSGRKTMFPQEIAMSNANALLQQGKYQEALALISGTDSMSYYNRGVIESIGAYQLASGGPLSGLTLASTMLNEAANSFLVAQKLQINKNLQDQIVTNLQTISELNLVINAKTCYTISRDIITNISGLQQSIDATQKLLVTETQSLQKSSASAECKTQRQDTITTSQANLNALHQTLVNQDQIQQKKFKEKRLNPALCIDTQNPEVINNFLATQKMISSFQQEHEQSSSIRSSQDADLISELCKTTKNDSQINESIQSTIDKLLSSLNEQTSQPSTSFILEGQPLNSNSPQYIPLNTSEQKLLENIDKKNKIRIRQIQRLKSDPEYQGMDYIQKLFYQFYGNTGDFQ